MNPLLAKARSLLTFPRVVIVIAPLTASQIQMQNLALAKLKRRLESQN